MFENRDLLTWKKSGCKKINSTANQLFYTEERIYKNLDIYSSILFVDLSKAFKIIYHSTEIEN